MASFIAYLAGIWTAIILVMISPFLIRGYRRGLFQFLRVASKDRTGSPLPYRGPRVGGGAAKRGVPVSSISKNHTTTFFHVSGDTDA